MNKEEKFAIKKQELDAQMLEAKKTEYSASGNNDLVKDINSLIYLNENEELPYRVDRFCQEYVVHYDSEKAALRAGYPLWSAASAGRRLLTQARVKAEIERLQKNISVGLKITRERVLSEYAKLAYSNVQDLFNDDGTPINIKDLNRDVAATIGALDIGVKVIKDADGNETIVSYIKKVKVVDKKVALDALAKHLALFEKETSNQNPVDFKTFLAAIEDEKEREQWKIALAKRINGGEK